MASVLTSFGSRDDDEMLQGLLGNSTHNILLDLGMARCPHSSGSSMDFPSSTIIYGIFAGCSFLVAAIVAIWYNHVVWSGGERNDVLRASRVSNAPWVSYFVVTGIKALIGCILLAVNSFHTSQHVVDTLQFVMDSLHATSDLALTVAMFHQYYHRSDSTALIITDNAMHSDETSSEGDGMLWWKIKNLATTPEFATAVLALVTVVTAWFSVHESQAPYSSPFWVYITFVALQRLPIYGLLGMICAPNSKRGGPTRASRLVLLLGFLLALPYDIPYKVWVQNILPDSVLTYDDGCPLHFMSILDCMMVLHAVAALNFLYFIIAEFQRTHELEYYDCIQHYTACS
eukprot:TRINITY_DN1192_c1_g1_i1.p1 TRINITY_DN1192_c1_g1~~TRINITY_DN1192_c1_g1_i1.p1  ORF type:complete len:344 (+),score=109.25 TRINITY_DN1192_c1_g1_i1:182-1213(+)